MTKTTQNITLLQGELRSNASAIATATEKAYGATRRQAELLVKYFDIVHPASRWFAVNTQEKTPLADEVRIQRALVVDTLKEKGHANGRVVWQRIKQLAWEIACPAEVEAEKQAKEKAKAQKESDAEGEGGVMSTVEVTGEMREYAMLLAGSCDWDKSLANKVLALVFTEAMKANKKA